MSQIRTDTEQGGEHERIGETEAYDRLTAFLLNTIGDGDEAEKRDEARGLIPVKDWEGLAALLARVDSSRPWRSRQDDLIGFASLPASSFSQDKLPKLVPDRGVADLKALIGLVQQAIASPPARDADLTKQIHTTLDNLLHSMFFS